MRAQLLFAGLRRLGSRRLPYSWSAGILGLSAVLMLAGFHNWEPHANPWQGIVMNTPKSGVGIVTGVMKSFKTEQECRAWESNARSISGRVYWVWGEPQLYHITGGCRKVG